ncbi:acyl-CoA carboxylase epsilon subunit [Streptomyces sp. NPDC020330]|uniref:acyl-CoA carboxylase epsilon subunit n=1 Tax=unclassified Streptomyces TaxID=2593676 RepID=UPI0037AE2A26
MTDTAGTPLDGPLGPALIKVIRGNPTREELAAVAALLLARDEGAGRRARRVARTRAARWSASRADVRLPRSWMSEE